MSQEPKEKAVGLNLGGLINSTPQATWGGVGTLGSMRGLEEEGDTEEMHPFSTWKPFYYNLPAKNWRGLLYVLTWVFHESHRFLTLSQRTNSSRNSWVTFLLPNSGILIVILS